MDPEKELSFSMHTVSHEGPVGKQSVEIRDKVRVQFFTQCLRMMNEIKH